jgi:hypothetical protein
MLRRARADFQTLSVAQPGEARVLRRLAATHMYIGRRLAATGHGAAAAPSLREAIRIADGVTARNPKDLLAQNYTWRASQELTKVMAGQQQRSDAPLISRKAIAAGEAARSADGANPVTQSFLPQAWSTRVMCMRRWRRQWAPPANSAARIGSTLASPIGKV